MPMLQTASGSCKTPPERPASLRVGMSISEFLNASDNSLKSSSASAYDSHASHVRGGSTNEERKSFPWNGEESVIDTLATVALAQQCTALDRQTLLQPPQPTGFQPLASLLSILQTRRSPLSLGVNGNDKPDQTQLNEQQGHESDLSRFRELLEAATVGVSYPIHPDDRAADSAVMMCLQKEKEQLAAKMRLVEVKQSLLARKFANATVRAYSSQDQALLTKPAGLGSWCGGVVGGQAGGGGLAGVTGHGLTIRNRSSGGGIGYALGALPAWHVKAAREDCEGSYVSGQGRGQGCGMYEQQARGTQLGLQSGMQQQGRGTGEGASGGWCAAAKSGCLARDSGMRHPYAGGPGAADEVGGRGGADKVTPLACGHDARAEAGEGGGHGRKGRCRETTRTDHNRLSFDFRLTFF